MHDDAQPNPTFSSASNLIIQPSVRLPSLPEFWDSDTAGFFEVCENLFEASGVTDETLSYRALFSSFSKLSSLLKHFSDLLPSSDTGHSYSTLKTRILDRLSKPSDQCLSDLLSLSNRSKLTVREYLTELRSTARGHYDTNSPLLNDLLRRHILLSVDPTTRTFLTLHDDLPLDELAVLADKLLSASARPSSSALHQHTTNQSLAQTHSNINTPPQHIINEIFDHRINSLQESFSSVNELSSHQRPTHESLHTTTSTSNQYTEPPIHPPRAPSSRDNDNTCCYHHYRFGERAFKCEGGPCPFFSPPRGTRHSGNVQASYT